MFSIWCKPVTFLKRLHLALSFSQFQKLKSSPFQMPQNLWNCWPWRLQPMTLPLKLANGKWSFYIDHLFSANFVFVCRALMRNRINNLGVGKMKKVDVHVLFCFHSFFFYHNFHIKKFDVFNFVFPLAWPFRSIVNAVCVNNITF